jgi:CubicO group peptidase (beta-lactamase class C family)
MTTFGGASASVGAASVTGHAAPGFEVVADAFRDNFTLRHDLGAAFAAYVDGQLVVDLWGGLSHREDHRAWERDTIAPIFSGSKGLVAACMLLLIDRRQLDLAAPVCSYWPEFAAAGKERITVAEAISHRAGLPGIDATISLEDATDPVAMAGHLARQAPVAVPDGAVHYHALTFGWLCAELVRRVDGRSIGTFFDDELATPLALRAWIGLPAELEHQVARIAKDPELGLSGVGLDALGRSIWANPPRFDGELAANRPMWHAAEVPATSAIADARSMAAFYAGLGSIISAETLALATQRLSGGREPYLQAPMAFSTGFQVPTAQREFGPVDIAFGHGGTGGSVHGCWPTLGVTFSYTMNDARTQDGADPRAAALLQALHGAAVSPRR